MNKPLARVASGRRIQAIGAYGFGNFGDELFVATILENAHVIWPQGNVRTFTSDSRFYSSPGFLGQSLRLGTAALGFLWADTIAMCGGSILEDVRGIARLRQPFLKYRTTEAIGVSVGPFPTEAAAERVRQTIDYVDRLIVRDQASVERLRDLCPDTPVSLGGDLVALSTHVEPNNGAHPDVITICPSAAAPLQKSTLRDRVLEALATFIAETGRRPAVRLLALSQHPLSNDFDLCKMLFDSLSAEGFVATLDTFEELRLSGTCKAIAESVMVWSFRLHGAIVAYLSEVPFLIVGHHAKCVDFGQDVGVPLSTILSVEESWTDAVSDLANGAVPRLPPSQYRARAHAVYLNDATYTGPQVPVMKPTE